MNVIGWVVAVIGFFGALVGLFEMLKRKKMQRVPFHAPGDLAAKGRAAADAKGWVSTEGKARTATPLTAPLSGKPCLAYEVEIVRHFEKVEQTENGSTTKKGSDKVETIYEGVVFELADDKGNVLVDATLHKPDTKMHKTTSEKIKVGTLIPESLQFGTLQLNTPSLPRDSRTTAFEATETILEPSDTMYAMGALRGEGSPPTLGNPEKATFGRLTLAKEGRGKLLASTKRNMILGYAIGGAFLVGGSVFGFVGPKGPACADFKGELACKDKLNDRDKDLTWTVERPGIYQVSLRPNVSKSRVREVLSIFNSANERVAFDVADELDEPAHVKEELQPGTYRINLSDTGSWLKGGRSYKLDVVRLGDIAEKVAAAPAPSVSATCEKAADCCDALDAKARGKLGCDTLRAPAADDNTCATKLTSMRRMARRCRSARAVCN